MLNRIIRKLNEGAQDQRLRHQAIKAYKDLLRWVRRFKGRFWDSFNAGADVGWDVAWDMDKICGPILGNEIIVHPGPQGHSIIPARHHPGSKSGSSLYAIQNGHKAISWDLRVSPDNWADNLHNMLDHWMEAERSVFIHEYVHALDHARLGTARYAKAMKTGKKGLIPSKLHNPAEWNAYFITIGAGFIMSLDDMKNKVRKLIRADEFEKALRYVTLVVPDTFSKFIKVAKSRSSGSDEQFITHMSPQDRKKYIRRLLQTYQDLEKQIIKIWPELKGYLGLKKSLKLRYS